MMTKVDSFLHSVVLLVAIGPLLCHLLCDASSRAEPLDEEAFLYKKIREQFVHLVVPTTDETILREEVIYH